MTRVPLIPGRWIVPLIVIGAFAWFPALWPVHGFAVFLASLTLRLGLSVILLMFLVRFFRSKPWDGVRRL